MISDGEVSSDVVPTAWCHSLTILTSLSRTPLSTVAHPVPAAAKSCSPESVCSESLVTQKIRNRSIRRIHCRSSSGVYLPGGRSWRALLRRQSQAVLSKFRALFLLAVAASKPKIQARRTCKFRWGQTIYAAERLHADRLTSSCPIGPALRTQQASTPPQSKCHKRGSSRWAARAGGASGTTVASCGPRNINGTPDGRHLGHRCHRAKSIDPTEKWLHRLDPGDSASLDSEI